MAFVLLRDSRFNFHCYTQREATPTQKSARKCAATSCAKGYKAHWLANQLRWSAQYRRCTLHNRLQSVWTLASFLMLHNFVFYLPTPTSSTFTKMKGIWLQITQSFVILFCQPKPEASNGNKPTLISGWDAKWNSLHKIILHSLLSLSLQSKSH